MNKLKKHVAKEISKSLIVEPIEKAIDSYIPFSNIYHSIKKNNLCKFLETLYDTLKRDKNLSREEVDHLIEEVGNNESKQYMSTILDTLCFSKGLYAVQILAFITCKYSGEEDLDYCDLYLISALNDLYNTDLNTFFHVFMYNSKKVDDVAVLGEYSEHDRIVLDKLQNLNIFGRDRTPGRLTNGKDKPLYYEITEVSKRLYSYCMKIMSAYD